LASIAIAVFSGAFLVFQVQPIIARFILPWYGGAPAVWSTCMLFFQLGLLAGYAYAHVIATNLSFKRQALLHCALILLAIFLLPVSPEKPVYEDLVLANQPQALGIFKLLIVTVGFPFFLLSASTPLLQHWFANRYPGASPFRLYSLSNTGSLLALISYPFVVEPALALKEQTMWWSLGFVFFGLVSAACALQHFRKGRAPSQIPTQDDATDNAATSPIRWGLFAACGSVLLLATTNQMCQDVATIPFLWVAPLSLYLISFIICFERDAWYRRAVWIPLFAVSASLLVYVLHQDYDHDGPSLAGELITYFSTLFTGAMVCHGELTRLKPHKSKLTLFYLYIALGGATGGILVNLVAPVIFSGFWELHISLTATALIACLSIFRDGSTLSLPRRVWFGGATGVGVITLGLFLMVHVQLQQETSIIDTRGFFGVLHVYEDNLGTDGYYRSMYHGRIRHGGQWLAPGRRETPMAYYGNESGVSLAITEHPVRKKKQPLFVGVVGLGAGTLCAYGKPGDRFRFYEINSQVISLAHDYFSFLTDTQASVEIITGDGRLVLENEFERMGSNNFDVLVIDAFSGDAIPIHLLTAQASELYWQHLKKDGILAIHITNNYLNLSDVARGLARHAGKPGYYFVDEEETETYADYNEWVLITDNLQFGESETIQGALSDWAHPDRLIHWTDDYSSLFEVVRW